MDMEYYEANVNVKYDGYTITFLQNGDRLEWKEGPTEAQVVTSNLSRTIVSDVGDDDQEKVDTIPGDPKHRGN